MGKDNRFNTRIDDTFRKREAQRRAEQSEPMAQRFERSLQSEFRRAAKSGNNSRIAAALAGLGATDKTREAVVTAAKSGMGIVNSQNQLERARVSLNNVNNTKNARKVVPFEEEAATTAPEASTPVNGTGGQPAAPSAPTALAAGQNTPSGAKVDPLAPPSKKPAVSDYVDTKQKFADDLLQSAQNGLLAEGDTTAYANAVKRGIELGVSEDDIHKYLGSKLDANPLENQSLAGRKAQAKLDYDKRLGETDKDFTELMDRNNVTPEQRKMFGKLSPEDRKAAMEDHAARLDMLPKSDENIDKAKALARKLSDSMWYDDAAILKKLHDPNSPYSSREQSTGRVNSAKAKQKPMMIGGEELDKATPEERQQWANEALMRQEDAFNTTRGADPLSDRPFTTAPVATKAPAAPVAPLTERQTVEKQATADAFKQGVERQQTAFSDQQLGSTSADAAPFVRSDASDVLKAKAKYNAYWNISKPRPWGNTPAQVRATEYQREDYLINDMRKMSIERGVDVSKHLYDPAVRAAWRADVAAAAAATSDPKAPVKILHWGLVQQEEREKQRDQADLGEKTVFK